MAEYYAVERSHEYLIHYGKRGMKWGVRKAVERIGSNMRRSKEYMDAHKKLQKRMMGAQMVGGLAGSALYAAKHRNELKKSKKPMGVGFAIGNKAYINEFRKTKNKVHNQRNLYKNAMDAGKRVEDARKKLSFLGKHGFGKTAREYRNANIAQRNATNAYYDSLSKKQYAKLRRKHVG